MLLQDRQIVIKPVRRKLRDGWFGQSASEAALVRDATEAQVWRESSISDDSEWVW